MTRCAMCGRLRVGKAFLHVCRLAGAAMCSAYCAAHKAAGHNALRGSGPGQKRAFEMHWHMWVVLIAGSAGSALRAVRPPNLHIAPDLGAIFSRRKCDGFFVAITPGHHGPRHSCDLVGERDRGDLGRPPRQQSCEPWPVLSAMDLGIADHRQRARREQAAQIAITLFADTAELVLAPARVLLRNEPNPGRKIPPRSEGLWISDAGDQSRGERGTNAGNLIQPFARLAGSVPGDD